MKRKIAVCLVLFILIFILFVSFFDPLRTVSVLLGDVKVEAEVACTPEAWERGLSLRPSLPSYGGMLFVFPYSSMQQFWMKDMLFPIDIIWLNHEGRVLGFEDSVLPEMDASLQDLRRYSSSEPVSYVLEVTAGLRALSQVRVDDLLLFNTSSLCARIPVLWRFL